MNALKYTLKVWQTCVFVSPLVLMALGELPVTNVADTLFFLMAAAIVGMVGSLPCAILLWLAAIVVAGTKLPQLQGKLLLSLASTILTLLLFFFISGGGLGIGREPAIILSYISTITISMWLYKLSPENYNVPVADLTIDEN